MVEKGVLVPDWQISSEEFPSKDRLTTLNDLFGSSFLCEIRADRAQAHQRPYFSGTGFSLGALPLSVSREIGLVVERDQRHTDQTDDCILCITLEGQERLTRGQGEYTTGPGEANVIFGDDRVRKHTTPTQVHTDITLLLPSWVVATTGKDRNELTRRPLGRDNAPLQMLTTYLRGLLANGHGGPPELISAAGSHICDLASLAIGATGEQAHAAQGGIRAARLAALKADIIDKIGVQRITLEETARRQGISPAYVRKLFAGEGTSFSAYVMEQKLAKARRMLCSTRHRGRNISAVAFACGFDDLSYFNRCFRRRYGMTPSDARASAMER